ncbi:unnamed protein product [Effrenium voratum]|nr:unnamed protein product [Effrenium voratum]
MGEAAGAGTQEVPGAAQAHVQKCKPSVLTKELQHLVRRKNPGEAALLLRRLRAALVEANIIHHNCIICAAERAGDWRLSTEALAETRCRAVPVDVISFNTVLSAAGLWTRAVETLQALAAFLSPDATSFNTLLSACNQCSAWAEGLDMLRSLPSRRVPPDAFAQSAAVSACSRVKLWETALRCSPEASDTVVTLGSAVKALEQGCQWQAALIHLDGSSCHCNVVVYSAVTSACETSSAWRVAMNLVEDVVAGRLESNIVMQGTAMKAAAHDWRHALDILARMMQDGLEINTIILGAGLSALLRASQRSAALTLSVEMLTARVSIDAETYGTMVAACAPLHQEKATELLHQAAQDGLAQMLLTKDQRAFAKHGAPHAGCTDGASEIASSATPFMKLVVHCHLFSQLSFWHRQHAPAGRLQAIDLKPDKTLRGADVYA